MKKAKIRIVTTSWDDGHKLDLRLAVLLKKYGVSATFYIAPDNRQWDKKNLLTREQIKELSKNFEIGSHTMTHPLLTQLSSTEALKEIKGSKVFLEKLIGTEVKMFSYPRGIYNQEIKDLLKNAGFLGARTIKTFRTSLPTDYFEMGTTNHSVDRNIGYSLVLAIANNPKFIPFLFTRDWVEISCRIFDIVQANGGIWHFWGHSWQIEENSWWDKIEDVLKYVSQRPGFSYFTNQETLNYLQKNNA